jgi:hypothetical protein
MAGTGGKRPGVGRPAGAKTKARVYDALEEEASAVFDGDIAEAARGYGPLALKVLSAIAASGESEAARVSAASSLLDRGYGRPAQTHTLDHKVTIDGRRLLIRPIARVTRGSTFENESNLAPAALNQLRDNEARQTGTRS